MSNVTVRTALVGAAAVLLALSGCAAEPSASDGSTETAPPKEQSANKPAPSETTPEPAAPVVQEESCGWDVPAIPADGAPAGLPSGQGDDLSSTVVGAWQHTHYDTGAGYEPLSVEDIRFVFPSAERLLYCQDVPGITDQAENSADISWDGATILVSEGTRLYTVESWNNDTMVWINERDGSRYLLQRR